MQNEKDSGRRRSPRYQVRAPILVDDQIPGVTTDISAGGVAFECNQPLLPGQRVFFELTLTRSGVLLHCGGEVVRVEEREGAAFVAATIDKIRFDAPDHTDLSSIVNAP